MNSKFSDSLRLVAKAIEHLEMQPASIYDLTDGHVTMLCNEDLAQCRHYRVEQKQEQFALDGIKALRYKADDVTSFTESLVGARAAIFYRLPATPAVMRAILTARRMGVPTYYDIDDLIFASEHYPANYRNYQAAISLSEYRGLQFGVPLFRFAMSLCDRAIASTPALLQRMAPVVREHHGFVLRNGLDSRNAEMIALGKRADRVPIHDKRVRIFYGSGTLAHNADFSELVAPALSQILDDHPNVDIVLAGHVPNDACLKRHSARMYRFAFSSNVKEFWAILASCDINIAVLVPDPATDCKSEIKWLEAAVLGIPTVASGTVTYREVIDHETNGFIASTQTAWLETLKLLVTRADVRWRVGDAAREAALRTYGLAQAAAIWQAEFPQIVSLPKHPGRRRVLVCNVFFSPQSIGGATRVVENNVTDIMSRHPDIAMGVFCTDEGIGEPGHLRTSSFGEVPVFRLGVQTVPDMDRTLFNPDNVAAFRAVIESFEPDLVHFHCVQRMTASVVEECLRSGIPYIVTVHDAWWISRHQFLVDEDGIMRLPTPDLLSGDTEAHAAAALLRRSRAKALLAGARHVVAVSDSFADIYRSAGITSVISIPNGIPTLPAPFCPDDHRGPLRLALIGGRASHKGADLVEAAFRAGDYPNLQLLVIDGWLAPAERFETRWGTSKVTISAPYGQDDVALLYADMDVLLAPSRWPESYGLVAREAAHFGLWVVASSIGAMGEDIVEGVNGFRIDTGDRQDLDRLLRKLDDDPDRYRQGTARPASIPARRAHEQADDLAELYRQLLPQNSGET